MRAFFCLNVGSLQRRHPPVSSGVLSEVTCSGPAIQGIWAAGNLETGGILILGRACESQACEPGQGHVRAPSESEWLILVQGVPEDRTRALSHCRSTAAFCPWASFVTMCHSVTPPSQPGGFHSRSNANIIIYFSFFPLLIYDTEKAWVSSASSH